MSEEKIFIRKKNTNELIQANLLKYSFLAKRQIAHGHVVPAKFRLNNIKLAIEKSDKERINLTTNLNVALQKSKIKQDTKHEKDIFKLHNQRLKALSKLKILRRYSQDLNKELTQMKKKHEETLRLNNFSIKPPQKNQIPVPLDQLLYKTTIRYNKGIKKQKELKQTLNDTVIDKFIKKKIYDSLLNQLSRNQKAFTETSEQVFKLHKERQQTLNNLEMLRDNNATEKRERNEKMYAAKYRFQINFDGNEFLRKKRRVRYVKKNANVDKEEINKTKNNDELVMLMKYLIHINGDTDLIKITDKIKEIANEKDSLFRLLMFFEQQFTMLENYIDHFQGKEISRLIENDNRNELNRCQLKKYVNVLRKNAQTIKSSQEFINYLKNTYKELCEHIGNTCETLKIRPPTNEPTERNALPNEDNISDYLKEMEKKSFEIIFKLNCIESSCLKGQNEDTITSDGESMQNLIIKDYNGIEIKMRRLLRM